MKDPVDYLIEHYGCKDLNDLQKCFLNPNDISITMLAEAIELAQKDAYNQAIEDAINAIKLTDGGIADFYAKQSKGSIIRLKIK